MKTKPLSPVEIQNNIEHLIPEVVILAVNNLLEKEFRGRPVTLRQDEILTEILRLDKTLYRNHIFDNNWMDFEPLFEKAGWKVEYINPSMYDEEKPYFTFTPKRKNA